MMVIWRIGVEAWARWRNLKSMDSAYIYIYIHTHTHTYFTAEL